MGALHFHSFISQLSYIHRAMEVWFVVSVTLCVAALIRAILGLFLSASSSSPGLKIPPGPPTFPVIGNLLWLGRSIFELEPILCSLLAKYGPILTLHVGPRPAVFIADRFLAHQALVQKGAVFADRPPALLTDKILSSNQHIISSAFYGPTWRVLRRNLTAGILQPAQMRSYAPGRRRVLDILLDRLRSVGNGGAAVRAIDHFQYAMFCLLVLMCFGDGLEEGRIREVESVQTAVLKTTWQLNALNFLPRVGRFLFRRRWEEFVELRRWQRNVLLPLITARSEARFGSDKETNNADQVVAYVDTLLNVELPTKEGKGKRKLSEVELISLCSEFLNAGTDTTSTTLQWIMANIVKHPEVQQTLHGEIREAIGLEAAVVEEEDLQRLPYVKAVVLEGLRRHPPGHFLLPHAVTEDTELGRYLVPRDGTVNFMVAQMGLDSVVWEDPMAFKPERFLSRGHDGGVEASFDITGSREIKMMPFGAGRRMCPGYSLALLLLEYLVANLVWAFEWKAEDGAEVDLSDEQAFIFAMKYPLQAVVVPRSRPSYGTENR